MPQTDKKPSSNAHTPIDDLSVPWWCNPYCWLILAGPLTVIVAGFITLWIAVSGADKLVDENYYQKGMALSQKSAGDPASLLPAKQARNHAATGGAPAIPAQPDK